MHGHEAKCVFIELGHIAVVLLAIITIFTYWLLL